MPLLARIGIAVVSVVIVTMAVVGYIREKLVSELADHRDRTEIVNQCGPFEQIHVLLDVFFAEPDPGKSSEVRQQEALDRFARLYADCTARLEKQFAEARRKEHPQ